MTATHRPSVARGGFTLVELLVVVMIIAVLAALVTPVVMRSLSSARNAAIKAEIDMLHMALMNYKNEYGSFPPGISDIANVGDPAVKHLARIFPRCQAIPAQINLALPQSANPRAITTLNAIAFWLSGYTSNPLEPLATTGESRKKLFDFDNARINPVTGGYTPSGKPGSPYLYVPASQYGLVPYAGGATPGAMVQTYKGDTTPFYNTSGESNPPFNPDTFQIICAGRDEQFGTDDDVSNFWPSTRKEYLDSLK